MANRDIAQEIINAVKSGKPDYVVTGLVKERDDKIKTEGLSGKVPTTSEILDYAGSFIRGTTKTSSSSTAETPATTPQPVSVVSSTPTDSSNLTGILGYDPNAYYSAGSAQTSGKTVAGYAIVALIGVVILDRLLK